MVGSEPRDWPIVFGHFGRNIIDLYDFLKRQFERRCICHWCLHRTFSYVACITAGDNFHYVCRDRIGTNETLLILDSANVLRVAGAYWSAILGQKVFEIKRVSFEQLCRMLFCQPSLYVFFSRALSYAYKIDRYPTVLIQSRSHTSLQPFCIPLSLISFPFANAIQPWSYYSSHLDSVAFSSQIFTSTHLHRLRSHFCACPPTVLVFEIPARIIAYEVKRFWIDPLIMVL